jgi:hypothetical protein
MTPSAAARRSRRYDRPRRPFSWLGVLIGLGLGMASGFYWAWEIAPIVEYDTEPWQLNAPDKAAYIVAVMLRYDADGDVGAAVQSLIDLRLQPDPIQAVADTACQLATSGYVNNASGLSALRAMMNFYQGQGRRGCADDLIQAGESAPTQVVEIAVPTNTPTLPPPDTKTPTPGIAPNATATPNRLIVPTSAPQSDFVFVNVTTFCESGSSGEIQVYVYEIDGATGVPGQAIRARWNEQENRFFTGLKPERGAGYADFTMEADVSYLIDLPGASDPIPQPLVAVSCTTPEGQRAIISYRVTFRAVS